MLQAFFDWFRDRIADAVADGLRQGIERAKGPQAIEHDEDRRIPDEANGRPRKVKVS